MKHTINLTYTPPPPFTHTHNHVEPEPKVICILWAHSPISYEHVSFWCPIVHLYLTTCFWCVGSTLEVGHTWTLIFNLFSSMVQEVHTASTHGSPHFVDRHNEHFKLFNFASLLSIHWAGVSLLYIHTRSLVRFPSRWGSLDWTLGSTPSVHPCMVSSTFIVGRHIWA